MNPLDESWYPSCVVKLTIRFDEALHIGRPRDEVSIDALGSQTQEARTTGESTRATTGGQVTTPTGQHRPRQALDRAASIANTALSSADERFSSELLTPGAGAINARGGVGTQIPQADTEPLTFGTDSFTVVANRVPRKGSFTLPHPRSAPTFSLTFDYDEFPIDPDLIRAAGVEIHLGAVPAEDFARGMRGEVDEDGRPLSILKTTTDIVDSVTGRKQVNDATLLFYATADTWKVSFEENRSVVTLEGREIRAILIDAKIVPTKVSKVDLKQPIDLVVADLLQTIGFENGFRLTTATLQQEWPNGQVPSPGDADGMTAVRVKAASRAGAKTKEQTAGGGAAGVRTGDRSVSSSPDNGGGGEATYWDLITNYCEIVGGMPYIVGSTLWIRPVHRIFDVVDPGSSIPTPFARGQTRAVGDEDIRVRRLVLGRNIKRLEKTRKFGGVATVPTVQTISFDDAAAGKQRLIFGQWPAAGSDSADAKADAELLRVPMWGIRSKERLTQIARGIYEEIGRGETGGTVQTDVLASLGGDNMDPDILRLRPLEPIEFVVDASANRARMPIAADANRIAGLSFDGEVDHLHEILGDRQLARALVALSRGAVRELIRYYQVVGVSFEWDAGIKTTASFQNYIIPRHFEAAESDQQKTETPDVRTKPVRAPGAANKARAKAKKKFVGPPKPGRSVDEPPTFVVARPRRLGL